MKQIDAKKQPARAQRFELEDVLLLAGVFLITGGIAVWSRAAAAIVLGSMCFCAVLLIQKSKRVPTKESER